MPRSGGCLPSCINHDTREIQVIRLLTSVASSRGNWTTHIRGRSEAIALKIAISIRFPRRARLKGSNHFIEESVRQSLIGRRMQSTSSIAEVRLCLIRLCWCALELGHGPPRPPRVYSNVNPRIANLSPDGRDRDDFTFFHQRFATETRQSCHWGLPKSLPGGCLQTGAA